MPVRRVGVTVQIPADLAQLDEVGEAVIERGFDLSGILPELGRDARQPDRRIDLRLGRAREAPPGRDPEHPVFGDLEPLLHPDVPDVDVVLLRSGEVHEGRPEARGVDDPEIDLDAFPVADRALRGPALEHLRGLGQAREGPHDRGRLRGRHEDVDVADGLLHSPDGAREADPLDRGQPFEGVHELAAEWKRAAERHPLLAPADEPDALEDVLLGLRLDAGQASKPALAGPLLELVDPGDVLPLVEHPGRPGPDPGNVQQRDHPAGNPLARGRDLLDPPGPEVLLDLAREVGPDPGNVLQAVLAGDRLDVLAQRLEVLRGAAVGPDAERVLALELQDVRHELELPRHLEVLHPRPTGSGR